MLLALLLFITFLILFCSGDYDASRSIVYRCRVGDDCGGIGDRFTGIMGGAFYALLTGREFRIHWPDLVHVFTPQKPWLYAAEQLGVSEQQAAQIDNYYVRNVVGQELIPFVDGRPDIALLNDLNSRQITLPDRILEIEEYRHILFHSNRGPSPAMYEYFRPRPQGHRPRPHDVCATTADCNTPVSVVRGVPSSRTRRSCCRKQE